MTTADETEVTLSALHDLVGEYEVEYEVYDKATRTSARATRKVTVGKVKMATPWNVNLQFLTLMLTLVLERESSLIIF